MSEIFLSYASQDRETAGKVAALLTSAGWTVWWDRHIPAGRTWPEVLEEALTEMRCMVVLWSRNSVKSRWVKEEAEEGRTIDKLVPVLIDSVKPPVGFRAIQAADLINWDGSNSAPGARQLIADLESLLGKPDNKPTDVSLSDPETTAGEAAAAGEAAGIHTEDVREAPSTVQTPSGDSHWPDRLAAINWQRASIGIVTVFVVIAGFFFWSKRQSSEVIVEPPPGVVIEEPQVTAKSAAPGKKLQPEPVQPNVPAASLRPPESSAPYSNEAPSRRQLAAALTRARTYRVQGNYTAALAELERARAIEPANGEVRQEIEQTRKACNAEKSLGYNVKC